MSIIQEDLGFHLHQAVQRTKAKLSEAESSSFCFEVPGISISKQVARSEFESWIAEELDMISECLDHLLRQANVKTTQIDRVFLTGGTSFVPAVRQIFRKRFSDDRIATGAEFTSVAKGLALRSLELARLGNL
jgi:hypothetical chaperone protein